ncbi:UPF0052 hypothetical protein [Helicosporidium sp. ATCC 50920]|nr:UPF0052 hypothetical protein [Helicosporidium sp. ATCC 50920]|eukprot:KDD75831.1 UPF0052 hypothetical protein [Helicosporidium sp. ATCC 50920]
MPNRYASTRTDHKRTDAFHLSFGGAGVKFPVGVSIRSAVALPRRSSPAPLASLTTRVTHVLPVSDDGGSTAEIVRVLGGPALGDLRSRCLRLTDERGAEARAAQALLALRLHAEDESCALDEWESVLMGEHQLWAPVSADRRGSILRTLRAFDAAVRAAGDGGEARDEEVGCGGTDGARRSAAAPFRFRGGSVGNFFLAAARSQCTSLDAAVQLLCETVGVPRETLVLPAVQTEDRLTLGAELEDGTHVRGQNAISHPESCAPLGAAVRRVYYCRSEGLEERERGRCAPAAELSPSPHANLVHQLRRADAVVYGMGSLFTSLCPSLILRGVGEAVAAQKCPKILILNSCPDRETSRALGGGMGPMDAADCVRAVAAALNREGQGPDRALPNAAADYVTHLLYPAGGTVHVNEQRLGALGVAHVVAVPSVGDCQAPKANGGGKEGGRVYDPAALAAALQGIARGANPPEPCC